MEKILRKAWDNYKSNIAVFIGAFLISFLIPFAIVAIFSVIVFYPHISTFFTSGISGVTKLIATDILKYLLLPIFLTALCAIIAFPPFNFGFMYVVARGRKNRVKLSTLFDGVRIFWKRAILQNIATLFILLLVSLPFIGVGYDFLTAFIAKQFSEELISSLILQVGALFVLWALVILIVWFFLIYWAPSIVVYNKGVVEGLKVSVRKVRKNLLETFVVFLFVLLIAAVCGLLERAIPFIPSIILSPLITCLLVEACAQLNE